MIRARWVLVGGAIGASLAWLARPGAGGLEPPDPVGARPASEARSPGVGAPGRGSSRSSSGLALVTPVPSDERRVYDLMAFDPGGMVDVPLDEHRDPAWAVAMEAAIEQHTRRELLALRPDVIWQGARCRSTSCEVTYRAKGLDPAIASVVDTFIFGPGTMIARTTHADDDGLTTYAYRVVYRTPTSSVRLSADEYLARQQPRSAEDQALYAKLASYLADHRAGREVPP